MSLRPDLLRMRAALIDWINWQPPTGVFAPMDRREQAQSELRQAVEAVISNAVNEHDREPAPDGEHLPGYWRKLKEEHELMATAISKSIDALSQVGMPMHRERPQLCQQKLMRWDTTMHDWVQLPGVCGHTLPCPEHPHQ
jgi:hypothetical protein